MKMLDLAIPDDGRQFHRDVAAKAIEGNGQEPKKSVPVQLWETPKVIEGEPAFIAPDKDAQAKLVNSLRSGLSGAKDGVRFSVEHKGQIAWVSVNNSPLKARAPRAAKKAVAAKAPAPKK